MERTTGRVLRVLGLAGAIVLALWPVPVLTVRAARPARVLWGQPVRGAVAIRLEYTHSVERTPVAELYRADAQGLRLLRMEFASQGAGLPSAGYVREGDRFVLKTDRLLNNLALRVSAVARPRLVVGTQTLDLLALAGDGGTVVLAVRPRPRLAVLLGVLY